MPIQDTRPGQMRSYRHEGHIGLHTPNLYTPNLHTPNLHTPNLYTADLDTTDLYTLDMALMMLSRLRSRPLWQATLAAAAKFNLTLTLILIGVLQATQESTANVLTAIEAMYVHLQYE